MDLNYFKDKLFDILNETDELDITDICVDDLKDRLTVSIAGGNVFQIECRQANG